jgi:hypothetical protein
MPCRPVLLNVNDADYLGLIDNVEYKYLSHIIRNNILIRVEVIIEDIDELNHEGEEIMRATYTFDLKSDKEWVIQYNFTWTSCLGNKLNDILCDTNDDSNTNTTEDTDDIYSEPSSPRSVIN